MDIETPPVAFLGACDTASHTIYQDGKLTGLNLIGLKPVVLSPLFPLNLASIPFVFAVFKPFQLKNCKITLRSSTNEELFWARFSTHEAQAALGASDVVESLSSGPHKQVQPAQIVLSPHAWYPAIIRCGKDAFIRKPDLCTFYLELDNKETPIGSVLFEALFFYPLSEARIAAIKSNPGAAKLIQAHMGCSNCGDQIKAYAALERHHQKSEDEGFIWYADLPPQFECKCGKTKQSLEYMRHNLQGYLGQRVGSGGAEISMLSLFERRNLERVCAEFTLLLDSNPPEELVQSFLTKNPLLLARFSPQQVFFKSPILSKHKTDIVILTQRNEILLIEIERPGKRLLTKQGQPTAQLQQAVNQIFDWFIEVEQHRQAVLDCIGVDGSQVSRIGGVVIAGRDKGMSSDALKRFRWMDFGKGIQVFTYDDLISDLISLGSNMT